VLDISPHDKFAKYTAVAVLALLPMVGHAGGLGVAPLAFIMGLVGLFLHLKSSGPKFKKSPTFILLVLFLTWLCMTSLWSPYQSEDILTNHIKLFIMGLVFYFCPVVFKNLSPSGALTVTRVFLTVTLLGALLVLVDTWSGFKITFLLHPVSRPEALGVRLSSAEQNLGHAITLLALCAAPIMILLKGQCRDWKVVSFLFLCLIILSSFFNNLWVGALSILAVSAAMITAWKFPIKTPKMILMFWIIMILLAPMLAFLSSHLSQNDLTTVPNSWEHRVRMWVYCWDIIKNSPIFGDGFDAVRTYDETWTTRNGIEWTIVSLHPHNAGIHIWTEAGFIGALLASSLIFSLFKPVTAFAKSKEKSALVSGVLIVSLIICSTTYGAWQFWWWGSNFLTAGIVFFIGNLKPSRRMK